MPRLLVDGGGGGGDGGGVGGGGGVVCGGGGVGCVVNQWINSKPPINEYIIVVLIWDNAMSPL